MVTDAIEQLAKDTEALEPEGFKVGDYIRKPQMETEDAPEVGGMIVSDLESAGYVMLYDTVTREPSLVNMNMVAAQRKVRRENGSLVFTSVKPAEGPWRGDIKCFLHQDQPERAQYDAMGFSVCAKRTLPNGYQAQNHARHRHRDEWAAVEAEQAEKERREDRAATRAMLNAISGSTTAVVEPVVDTSTVNGGPPAEAVPLSGQCEQCDWKSNARKNQSRKVSLKQHMDRAHS
jgi:hypothetical protein